MHSIFCIEDQGKLHCLALDELKKLGVKENVKSRKPKQDVVPRSNRVFGRQLSELPLESVKVGPEEDFEFQVPSFVVRCCKAIIGGVETEGVFRKAGSAKRQKEIKMSLNAGNDLEDDVHIIDVANLLKQFLRELPEPLVPHSLHDIFISATQLREKTVEALQLACLMISNVTALATLSYICQVLDVVAASSSTNMMNVSNLAIIMVPSLMPLPEAPKGQRGNPSSQNPRLLSHKDVVEMLIKHSTVLGMVPESLLIRAFPEQFAVQSERRWRGRDMSVSKSKKKRRSGSFTRMMEGFRKMVGRNQSPSSESTTPDNLDAISVKSQKRKKEDRDTSFLSITSSKKKRKLGSRENIFDTTPFTPEMRHPNFKFANEDLSHRLFQSPALSLEPSPTFKPALGFAASECKKSKKFFTPKRLTLRSQSKRIQGPVAAVVPVIKAAKETKRRLSIGKKDKMLLSPTPRSRRTFRQSMDKAFSRTSPRRHSSHSITACFMGSCDSPETPGLFTKFVNPVQEETPMLPPKAAPQEPVPARESDKMELQAQYQELKFKVDQAAKELIEVSKDDPPPPAEEPAQAVAEAFLKTVDGTSELAQNCSESDQVVKILSRELKIRRSAEHKVIRSPSARKIGAQRRRSRETPKSLSQRSLGSPRRSRSRLTRSHSAVIGGKVVKLTPLLGARHLDRTSVRSNLRRGKPNTLRTGLPEPSPMRALVGSIKRRSQESTNRSLEGKQLDFSLGNSSTLDTTLRDESQDISHNEGCANQHSGSVLELVKAFETEKRGTIKPVETDKYGSLYDLSDKQPRTNIYHPMELRNSPKFQSMPENLEGLGDDKKSRRESLMWQSADNFFKNVHAAECEKRGRDSLKRLRAENAGRVYENVQIFDKKEDAFSRKVETYHSLPVRTRGKSGTCQQNRPMAVHEEALTPEIQCAGRLCQAHMNSATPRSRANIDQILAESCERKGSAKMIGLIPAESAYQQENIDALLSTKLNFDDQEIFKSPLKDSAWANAIPQTPVLPTPKLKAFLTPLKEGTPRIGRSQTQRRLSPMKPMIGERRRSPRLNSSPNFALTYGLTPKPKSDLEF